MISTGITWSSWCRWTNTLIADEQGLHDPSSSADRMVLGIRGQVSELERDGAVHRMVEARWNNYLRHLLRLAGTELALFEPAAVEAIFQATQGVPRRVNSLAHHALIAAALAKAKSASVDHVQAALGAVA
jgi:hypothetical protein